MNPIKFINGSNMYGRYPFVPDLVVEGQGLRAVQGEAVIHRIQPQTKDMTAGMELLTLEVLQLAVLALSLLVMTQRKPIVLCQSC